MTTGMSLLVLSFGAIGLYAMLAIMLEQRRPEIGVRVALGARPDEVVLHFFRKGMRTALVGLAFGLPVSLAILVAAIRLSRTTWALLPESAISVLLLVLGIAALASWLPARRAASVDPMVALRSE